MKVSKKEGSVCQTLKVRKGGGSGGTRSWKKVDVIQSWLRMPLGHFGCLVQLSFAPSCLKVWGWTAYRNANRAIDRGIKLGGNSVTSAYLATPIDLNEQPDESFNDQKYVGRLYSRHSHHHD